ncbi:MAG: capsular biosynthesis protein, partial [Pseudomonadota bacterium]
MPRNVLLLQGPVGPFFRNFAIQLEQNGHNVLKVNLNGGDLFYYQRGQYINYRNTPALWPFWIESIVVQREIERIYLFGDCRRYHRQAIAVAKRLGIEVFVFEEGYVRPN